ncbi:MAG: 4Fe-4S dicluster domain-containing protein [Desulfobacteraceae bacterium]|nr:4Fe-4S dicluster domain-containing protein [Desulfobacteraceae bacterium]
MQLKSFFGSPKPEFRYELLSTAFPEPMAVALPETVTLLIPEQPGTAPCQAIKAGAKVKTGQKLSWDANGGPSIVSSVTGTIQSHTPYTGDYGKKFAAIGIATEKADQWDESFQSLTGEPTVQTLIDHFSGAPGGADFSKLTDPGKPIKTIVVYGGDTDLLVETNLFVLKSRISAVMNGVKILKSATGIDEIFAVAPSEAFQNYDGHFEANVKGVPVDYPACQPLMIYYQLFGKMLEQGQSFEDTGVFFIRAEAVGAIGQAFSQGRVPVEKILTILDKSQRKHLVSARIGTPIGGILKMLNISLNDRDRIIFGGPMTGRAVYSEQQPVQFDTDAILVQDANDIILNSDYPCINCGECIRTCPTRVPVNMLIRFLEAGEYQDGADLYDLYSCVECGLCSYVCTARIPILQYIKLAKFELARMTLAEEKND